MRKISNSRGVSTSVEARRVISDSGRYRLVDVASAAGESVKSRSLRQCNGCEAAIALKLGADQSFVGVVTRISRTEYVVRFQIRDARTGAPINARQSDLRIGADYSWNRGEASPIDNGPFGNPGAAGKRGPPARNARRKQPLRIY